MTETIPQTMQHRWSHRVEVAGALLAMGLVCLVSAELPGAEKPRRWLAVMSDGRRVEGDRVTAWDMAEGTAVLDGAKLAGPQHPLRWLRDRQQEPLDPARSTTGFVEFTRGDRLPGRVVAAQPGRSDPWGTVPSGLVVQPTTEVEPTGSADRGYLTVDADQVRRIVFANVAARPRLDPASVFFRDGRRIEFRALRWSDQGIQLLTSGGVQRCFFAEIAEIHLPVKPSWESYFRELAVLAPRGEATLLRLETADGLVVTASTARFHLPDRSQKADQWRHVVQPSWCRQPLWVRSSTIRTWWRFATNEVLLSRIVPVAVTQRSTLGGNWPWRRDRSAEGDDLRSAGRSYGWGLGVHADNMLEFALPECARAFQVRVGLDRSSGRGGCAAVRVAMNDHRSKPLFAAGPLVGSEKVVDSGRINLPDSGSKRRSLLLVADAAHRGRPAGADPFDIRDHVDWLEPLLVLDERLTREQIVRAIDAAVPAWRGWSVKTEGEDAAPVRIHWDKTVSSQPVFATAVAPQGKRVTLSTVCDIASDACWLCFQVGQTERATRGTIEVLVDGKAIAEAKVYFRGSARPMVVPLARWHGRSRKVDVVYTPGDGKERTVWDWLLVSDRKERIDWRPLEILSARSTSGTDLIEQPTGSLAVDAIPKAKVDTHLIDVRSELSLVTALRLEVLPPSTLPEGNSGRSGKGGFYLMQFSAATTPLEREPTAGRYLRIEQPGEGKSLALAEVEVFGPVDPTALEEPASEQPEAPAEGDAEESAEDPAPEQLHALASIPPERRDLAQTVRLRHLLDARAENLAGQGRARQSSTEGSAKANLAVDGDRLGASAATRQQASPWWELDLGSERSIERIVICSADSFENRPRGFNVSVLDTNRQVKWRWDEVPGPPMPALELVCGQTRSLPLREAFASKSAPWDRYPVTGLLDATSAGWATESTDRAHAAVITLQEPLDPRNVALRLQLKQRFSPRGSARTGLRHFRILATDARSVLEAAEVPVEIPLLDEPGGKNGS